MYDMQREGGFNQAGFGGFNPFGHGGAGGGRRARGGNPGFEYKFESNADGVDLSDLLGGLFGGKGGKRRAGSGPFGGIFGSGFEEMEAPRPRFEPDIELSLPLTLEEAVKGAAKTIAFIKDDLCPACGGAGRTANGVCGYCRGAGQTSEETRIEASIPAGVTAGQKIRLAGQGRRNGSSRGDLYLVASLLPHPRFKAEGNDLYVEMELTPWDAALGCRRETAALDGTVEITVPPNAKAGTKLRLKNMGLGAGAKRGHLYVVLRIANPENLTVEQLALYKKLAETAKK